MIAVTVTNRLEVGPLDRLPALVLKQVRDRLTFPNPAHQEAQKRGFSTWNIPREILGYQMDGDRLISPRGFTRQLVGILHRAGMQFRVEDRRLTLPEVDFTFHGDLKDFQALTVEAMASRDFGTLAAPTGSGKTVTSWRRKLSGERPLSNPPITPQKNIPGCSPSLRWTLTGTP